MEKEKRWIAWFFVYVRFLSQINDPARTNTVRITRIPVIVGGTLNDPVFAVAAEVESGVVVVVGVEVESVLGVAVAVGVGVAGLPVTLIITVLLSVPSESVTVNVTV